MYATKLFSHGSAGFLKLVSPTAKSSKILFGPIKPTNPSVRMAYKGQSSFGITAILYTYRSCKTLFRLIKTHQSKWPIKVWPVSESLVQSLSCSHGKHAWVSVKTQAHRKVAASRSSVSHQMASMF